MFPPQAIMVSPPLGHSAKNCYVTYDVQIDGPNMTMEVFVNTTTGSQSISRIGIVFVLSIPFLLTFQSPSRLWECGIITLDSLSEYFCRVC